MATALGDLVVNLVAKTGNAVKGIGQVSKMLKTMGPAGMVAGTALSAATTAATILGKTLAMVGRAAWKVGKTIVNAFLSIPGLIWRGVKAATRFAAIVAGIGGAGGLAGFGLLVRGQMKAIDTTAKVSDKLGVATEQLVGLQHAAALAGMESRTFNMAAQRMTRRLSEAAMGTGEAKGALKELGLNAAALNSMPMEDKLAAIADALALVPNQADRVRLAFKLFDSEGVAMVNVLEGGGRALKDTIAEAQRLGIAFNRVDAAKVEAANAALLRMKAGFKGVINRVTIALAPIIERYANAVTSRMPAIVATIKRIGDMAVGMWNHVAAGFQRLWNWITESLTPFQDNFRNAFQSVMDNLNVMLGSWAGFSDGIIHFTSQAITAMKSMWEEFYHWLNMKLIANTPRMLGTLERVMEFLPGGGATAAAAKQAAEAAYGSALRGEEARHANAQKGLAAEAELRRRAWERRKGTLPTLTDALFGPSGAASLGTFAGAPGFAGGMAGGAGGHGQYAAAMERGSAAAQRTIYEAARGGRNTIAKQQLDEARRQTRHLGNIEDAIEADDVVSIPAA